MKYIEMITNSYSLKLLVVFIVIDVFFGILRSVKEKTLASSIGIDGIIRKIGMIASVIFCIIIDNIIKINFIGFLPSSILNELKLDYVGLASIFNILYIIFEILSIFKNMIRCKLPIPKKLQNYCEQILNEFTNEKE